LHKGEHFPNKANLNLTSLGVGGVSERAGGGEACKARVRESS
jgi:hypothetical protein